MAPAGGSQALQLSAKVESGTQNPLVRRLASLAALSDSESAVLLKATARRRAVESRVTLLTCGEVPGAALVLLDGFAACYRVRANGQRQMLGYLLPGDVCDHDCVLLGRRLDYALGTLTACHLAQVPAAELRELTARWPRIAHALRVAKLVAEVRSREWLVSLGCRTALERTAHLLCELLARLQAVGLATEDSCELPLTQGDLADTLGLSNVHMNRTLQALRGDGLIELRGRRLWVRDVPGLALLAEFTLDDLGSLYREEGRTERSACSPPSPSDP